MDCCSLRTASASAEVVSHIRNVSISENSLFNLGRRPQYLQTNAYLSEACFCFFKVSPRRRRGERWKITSNSGAPGLLMFAVYDILYLYLTYILYHTICLPFYHFLVSAVLPCDWFPAPRMHPASNPMSLEHPGCHRRRCCWVFLDIFGTNWTAAQVDYRQHKSHPCRSGAFQSGLCGLWKIMWST